MPESIINFLEPEYDGLEIKHHEPLKKNFLYGKTRLTKPLYKFMHMQRQINIKTKALGLRHSLDQKSIQRPGTQSNGQRESGLVID